MTEPISGFQYFDDRPNTTANAAGVVRIPAGLNRKRRLLATYAGQLQFPQYFGWNWDAFEECLRDLSWLNGIKQVTIVHRDVPFAKSPEQRAIYLSILQDRATSSAGYGPRVTVLFPESARHAVAKSLECE